MKTIVLNKVVGKHPEGTELSVDDLDARHLVAEGTASYKDEVSEAEMATVLKLRASMFRYNPEDAPKTEAAVAKKQERKK